MSSLDPAFVYEALDGNTMQLRLRNRNQKIQQTIAANRVVSRAVPRVEKFKGVTTLYRVQKTG